MATPKLVSLHVSPWSERAKWALDHHGIAYQRVEHLPIVGERRLRNLVGPSKPRATVPVLVTDGEVFSESWDIAAYADRVGGGAKLIPAEHEAAIRAWAAAADTAMDAGRALIVAGMIGSDAALDEGAPPFVPGWLRPVLRPATRSAMRKFGRKYGSKTDALDEAKRTMRAALDKLRDALRGKRALVGEAFSYADVVMATLMQGIAPVDDRYIRLGPATRRVWTQDDVARDYADLIAWRDELYASRRGSRAKA